MRAFWCRNRARFPEAKQGSQEISGWQPVPETAAMRFSIPPGEKASPWTCGELRATGPMPGGSIPGMEDAIMVRRMRLRSPLAYSTPMKPERSIPREPRARIGTGCWFWMMLQKTTASRVSGQRIVSRPADRGTRGVPYGPRRIARRGLGATGLGKPEIRRPLGSCYPRQPVVRQRGPPDCRKCVRSCSTRAATSATGRSCPPRRRRPRVPLTTSGLAVRRAQ